MRVETWVVNRQAQPERLEALGEHLADYGIRVQRFNAIEPDLDEVPLWRGRNRRDVPKKLAIARSYARLMEVLEGRDADRFLVMQDDARFTADPLERDFARPLHLYGGYPKRGRDWNDFVYREPHIHPWAFNVAAEFVPELRTAWHNPDRMVCQLWCRIIRPESTSYDNPPTVEAT